jgi:small conductance mechanosensitive channel
MTKIFIGIIFLFFVSFPPVVLFGQAADEEIENFSRTSKEVPIRQSPGDKQINERILRILEVTGWVKNLRVDTNEGVVRLRGTVDKRSQKDWIEDLAKDIDGVTAVTNEIEIATKGWFDLSPAKIETQSLFKRIVQFIPYLITSALVFALFMTFAFFTNSMGRKAAKRRLKNPLLIEIVAKLFALPVVVVGIYLVLQTSGLTGMAMTILGGTGAVGLIIGFATKNILENYFSGVMLSLRNPYTIGDAVEIDGKQGIVQNLTTRGTILIDYDGNHIIIPNTTIYNGMIINMSANPSLRIKFLVPVSYQANVNRVRSLITQILNDCDEVLKEPEWVITVEEFNLAGTIIGVYFWIDGAKSSLMKMKSKIMEMTKNILEKNNIDFPGADRFKVQIQREKDHPKNQDDPRSDPTHTTTSEKGALLENASRGRQIDHGDSLM